VDTPETAPISRPCVGFFSIIFPRHQYADAAAFPIARSCADWRQYTMLEILAFLAQAKADICQQALKASTEIGGLGAPRRANWI